MREKLVKDVWRTAEFVFIPIGDVLKRVRAETGEPVPVFGVCDNEHTGRGEVALWPSPTNTSPSYPSSTNQPPTLHPPPQPAHPAPLSSLKTSWFSEWRAEELCVCVCVQELRGWMAQCSSQEHEYSVLLLTDRPAHSHSAFSLFKLTSLSACHEYRPVLRNVHTNAHKQPHRARVRIPGYDGNINFKRVYNPHTVFCI